MKSIRKIVIFNAFEVEVSLHGLIESLFVANNSTEFKVIGDFVINNLFCWDFLDISLMHVLVSFLLDTATRLYVGTPFFIF